MKIIVAAIIFLIIGCIIGGLVVINILGTKTVLYRQLSDKHLYIMDIFKRWIIMLEEGQNIETYFMQHGYKTIAIYGMGYLGDCLLNGLKETDIKVKYLIDNKVASSYGEIPVYSINDDLSPVDVIVITPVCYFYSIKKQLQERTAYKLISIEDIFDSKF